MASPDVSAAPEALRRVAALGFAVFFGELNLNLIGVRSPGRVANRFDDTFHAVYQDASGTWHDEAWPCTTDPGAYWLENPGRVAGTAILCPGQYRGAYQLGRHRGEYEALVQVGPVKVWRDADRDQVLEAGALDEGLFGINIHRASATRTSTAVDRWSAGCQVFADPNDFARMLALYKRSAAKYGPKVSYTLLED